MRKLMEIVNPERGLLAETIEKFPGAVTFDDSWSSFVDSCSTLNAEMSEEHACATTGIQHARYEAVVQASLSFWRESTSKSFLHGLAGLTLGEVPKSGTPIFASLLWQTRFLLMCQKVGFLNLIHTVPVKDGDGKVVMIGGQRGLTLGSPGTVKFLNEILRALYLYWSIRASKAPKKLPKMIYRGIRAQDLYGHPDFKPLIASIFASDKTYHVQRKEVIDLLVRWICERKLHLITDGNILSFSASQPIADYFANKEGFILCVDPQKVDIISSELHDERLAGRDQANGKNEREYIVRIPPDYVFKPQDIIIRDLSYFVAENNPLCVGTFKHDDIEAVYKINGVELEAFYSHSSNAVLYNCREKEPYGYYGRGQFKKKFGFDPLPQPSNLASIFDFRIRKRRR